MPVVIALATSPAGSRVEGYKLDFAAKLLVEFLPELSRQWAATVLPLLLQDVPAYPRSEEIDTDINVALGGHSTVCGGAKEDRKGHLALVFDTGSDSNGN